MSTLASKKILMQRAALDKAPLPATPVAKASGGNTSAPTKYHAGALAKAGAFLFYGSMAFLAYAGWKTRHLEYLTPEGGLGYRLGITGGVILLVLALYPLRKKARFMRHWGPVKHWFRIHMALGVLGPVCILYHANFSLGSANSNVALFCMLTVMSSGLVGRFLYTRIHYGLYGSRATLKELKDELKNEEAEANRLPDFPPRVRERLHALAERALAPAGSFIGVVARGLFASVRHRWILSRLLHEVRQALSAQKQAGNLSAGVAESRFIKSERWMREYMETLTRISEFDVFARMFSFWHILHLPLFLMLLAAGIFHVFAVHAY